MYKSKVVDIGKNVNEFIDSNMLILFNETAPIELRDYCIIHKSFGIEESVCVNDFLNLGNKKLKITAIGEMANENLKNLGHVTLVFDSMNEASMYGNIHLDGDLYIPKVGEEIFITKE